MDLKCWYPTINTWHHNPEDLNVRHHHEILKFHFTEVFQIHLQFSWLWYDLSSISPNLPPSNSFFFGLPKFVLGSRYFVIDAKVKMAVSNCF